MPNLVSLALIVSES